MSSTTKILVTGASGFIGNYVINKLISSHVEVVATSSSSGKAEAMDWFDQVEYVPHDIHSTTQEDLYQKFGRPDKVIHLAWGGLPNYKALFHFEENLPYQYAFLKNLVQHGLTDVTITGTCFEYGMVNGVMKEDMLPQPANPYAIAKNTLRLFLEELQRDVDFQMKWVRLFYMYGKGQSPKSLLSQLDQALADKKEIFNMSGGKQVRDYLPVEMVANHIVSISLQSEISGIINCCSNQPITIEELVLDYLKKNEADIKLNLGYYPYPDFEPMEFWGDDTKLKSINN